MGTQYVYFFGAGKADGNAKMKELLGGKGANLAEMTAIGLPVPAGFTITTEVCTYYYDNKKTYPRDLDGQVKSGVAFIEKIMGTKFGDKTAMPLLVSVRSGARDSMPGMEARAPERTETRRGFWASPNFLPMSPSTRARFASTSAASAAGYCWLFL